MEQWSTDFDKCLELVKLLEEARLTEKYRYVRVCVEMFKRTHKTSYMRDLLRRLPFLIEEASKEIQLFPYRAPRGRELNRLRGEIPIAVVNAGGAQLCMDTPDFVQVLLGLGHPKTGKTYLTMKILHRILSMPGREVRVVVLDKKQDYESLIKLYPTLLVLRKKDLRYNHWETWPGDDPIAHLKRSALVLSDENFFGATSQPIIEAALHTCFLRNGIFQGTGNWPNYSQLLDEVINYSRAMKLSGRDMWDVISKIKTRLQQYIRTGEVFDCRKGYPLEFWLNNDIIINLDGMNVYEVRTFTIGLCTKILRYFRKHNLRGDKTRILFVCDEGQWLFSAERDKSPFTSNEAIGDVLREGREFGIGWIIGAHEPGGISTFVRNNAAFVACFRLYADSVSEAQKLLGLDDEQRKYLYRLAPKLEGVFRSVKFDRPILFRVEQDFFHDKTISQDYIDRLVQPRLKALQETIKPRGAEVPELYTDELEWLRREIGYEVLLLLEILQGHRFTPKTALLKRSGLSLGKFNAALDFLIQRRLITKVSCKTSRNRESLFFPLTEKAHDLLKTPRTQRGPRPPFFRHAYYCLRAKGSLEAQGRKVELEYSLKQGSPCAFTIEGRTVILPQRVDLFTEEKGRTIAFEVMLNFTNLEATILKCLDKMGIDELCIVCENRAGREKAQRMVAASGIDKGIKERITYALITDFL